VTSTVGKLNNRASTHSDAACRLTGNRLLTERPRKNGIIRQYLYCSNNGFTLIELIVVMALISTVLFFVTPRFQSTALSDSKKIITRWITTTNRVLRVNALKHQRRYAMHIDLDNGTLWTSSDGMTAEETEKQTRKSLQLPDDLKLIDVEYPGREKVTAGRADIFFYKENFSQMAFIHVEKDGYHKMTFQIEPFLPDTGIFEDYVEFEE
jgi:prepilin-type N-terminal cleavage/methylation domain-containing protein